MPSKALELALKPAEFIVLVKYWLGVDLFDTDDVCPLCNSLQEKSWYHSLVCKVGHDGGFRHDHLRNTALPYFKQAGLNPQT